MGKASRDKGARNERAFVNDCKAAGIDAERIPLSGAMKGSFGGDVRVAGYLGECKVRAEGFKTLYDWIDHDGADFLALRADRKDWLVVLTWDVWLKLLADAGLVQKATGATPHNAKP